jgi:hypothetical protein
MAARRYKAPGALALALLAAIALAGDGVNLKITNDSVIDVFVTVQDASTNPPGVVLTHQRINGFTSIPISVAPDAVGLANISWTAVRTDPQDRRCGHGLKMGLANDATVNVHADSDCTAQ